MLTYIKANKKVLAPHDVEYRLSRPEVWDLLLFIRDEEEAPILRTIKAAFADWDSRYLSEMIDLLIQEGYVERKDRRYYYTVPTIDDDSVKKVQLNVERLHFKWDMEVAQLTPKLVELAEQYQLNTDGFVRHFLFYIHGVIEQKLALERPKLIDCQVESLQKAFVMMNEAQAGNSHYFGMSGLDQLENHFHDYFLAVNRGTSNKTKIYHQIYDEIRDVNGAYFMDQCARKLKRAARRGVLAESDYSIFTYALEELGYLQRDEAGDELNIQLYPKSVASIWDEGVALFAGSGLLEVVVNRLRELGERVAIPLLPYWLFTNISTRQLKSDKVSDNKWLLLTQD